MKFLLVILLPLTLVGQNWTEPINISTMNGVNQNPDLFIDNSDILHCVWAHVIELNYSHIYYSKSEDDGISWSLAENISMNNQKRLNNPKVVVDSEEIIYVTYDYNTGDPIHSKILVKNFDGINWSQADTVSGNMLNCSKNKLIIDNNDRIYCFWNHAVSGRDYYYRLYENGNWSPIFHPYEGMNISFKKIVVDTENNLHVLAGHFEFAWYFDYLYYNNVTNLWSDIIQISDITSANGEDLDINNNNFPHVTWRHKTPGLPNPMEEDSTIYSFFNNTNWSSPELITEDPYDQKIKIINEKTYIMDWEKSENIGGNIVLYEKDIYNNWIGELVVSDAGSLQVMEKSTNKIHIVFLKSYDDNLNIHYMNKTVDTTTIINKLKFNAQTLTTSPNPFSNEIKIQFAINNDCDVLLKVYSFTGELIKTIVNKTLKKGDYIFAWDGNDNSGNQVANRTYLVRLKAGNNMISRSVAKTK